MSLPRFITRHVCCLFIAAVCAVGGGGLGVSSAHAQQQESGFLDRLDHPDRTLHYSPSDKTFGASSNLAGKQASVRPFVFNRGGTFGAGDGSFRTNAYNGAGRFRAKDYATHPAVSADHGFTQTGKTYGTKTVDVKEDRAAGKTMPIHEYANAEKPYLVRGKRQDEIDDLTRQKNLTIDQVRELLNKNK